MFKALRDRADRALRSATARSSAEATYEVIRRAVQDGEPATEDDARSLMLETLSKRRAWHRIGENEFECAFGKRTARLQVPVPFDTDLFFERIARAEVDAFLGDSEPAMLADLHVLAQRELRRLLDRDDPLPD